MPAKNVWPPHSKSARSQVSAALFYARTMTFVLALICMDNTLASRQQAKSQRYYLSQNIGLAVTGSAGPAPLPLCCTVEYVEKRLALSEMQKFIYPIIFDKSMKWRF